MAQDSLEKSMAARVNPSLRGGEDGALLMFLEERRGSAVQDPSTANSATPNVVERQ
jgi:hypothetical protein